MTLWVRDDAGKPRPLRVPLVDATAMDQQIGLAIPIRPAGGRPQPARTARLSSGIEAAVRAVVLDNGRPLIVPVEDTKIVPVSNPVY